MPIKASCPMDNCQYKNQDGGCQKNFPISKIDSSKADNCPSCFKAK